MANINKVLYNVDQRNDTSSNEKQTARLNIGASQVSYNNSVTDLTITKEIVRPYMNTKYTATVGNDSFLLLPNTFADGMVVKSNDSLNTRAFPKEVPTGGTNGQILTWNDSTYGWANPSSELPSHSSSDAGKALILDSSGNPIWSTINTAPSISRISEYATNDSPSSFGTTYGADQKREIHAFVEGTYPNTISDWIQDRDYKYGILHYTIGLELYNSDSTTKWCVIDQGHIQHTDYHIIGKGLYVPFAPGTTYVPIDHTVVFLKSDVGSILSRITIVMGLQTWPVGDPYFHAGDLFLVRQIHTDLTLFKW